MVGTPGRLLDLVKRGLLKLEKLRFFVVDECDKVLESLGKISTNNLEYIMHGVRANSLLSLKRYMNLPLISIKIQ